MKFILLLLAVFGFTYLLRYMDGPFDILRKVRKLFGLIYKPVHDGDYKVVDYIEEVPYKSLARLMGCFWCLSTWVSFAFSALFVVYYKYGIVEWFIISFACVGFSGIMHEVIRHD